ncbi:unnamed protein product [Symbiodinium natans]|uniref:Uncharacterized protein n=1 Tax=Symbiodinium natans TaxID=878477 RepID=A0A812R0J0_9DINO|nr:unnamed protein product [Symbiodinium natans]
MKTQVLNLQAQTPIARRFAHNSDGSLSFADGTSQEIYLDADWRQPFTVAPWKPVTSGGKELYPFSLSYWPLPGRRPPRETGAEGPPAARRTLMLAAPSVGARKRWLTTLARKVGSMQLRPSATFGEIGDCTVDHPKKRFVQLGQMQTKKIKPDERQVFRLPPARTELWQASSSLSVVRDLYDGYAADPLTASVRALKSRSASGHTSPTAPDEFMSHYLEKQAAIESLLHSSQWKAIEQRARPEPQVDERRPEDAQDAVAASAAAEEQVLEPQEVPRPVKPSRFEILARTANTKVEGAVLENKEWSGAALFARAVADDPSFELSVQLQNSPKTHPIFIGMAPPDADLCQANFFSSCGGVFLCLGGRASDGKLGALGAPGGPFVQGFGYRLVADLPKGHIGCTVQVNYTEAVDSDGKLLGHVCFMVSDGRGRLHQHKPQLRQPLHSNVGWLPCLLLCNPDTRVCVKHLK